MVLRPVPPVPITAFGNKNVFESQFALGFAGACGTLRIELARLLDVVPGSLVFGSAVPAVEGGVDLRGRHTGWRVRRILVAACCFGDGRCVDGGIAVLR